MQGQNREDLRWSSSPVLSASVRVTTKQFAPAACVVLPNITNIRKEREHPTWTSSPLIILPHGVI